jgi:hypothetical protein
MSQPAVDFVTVILREADIRSPAPLSGAKKSWRYRPASHHRHRELGGPGEVENLQMLTGQ